MFFRLYESLVTILFVNKETNIFLGRVGVQLRFCMFYLEHMRELCIITVLRRKTLQVLLEKYCFGCLIAVLLFFRWILGTFQTFQQTLLCVYLEDTKENSQTQLKLKVT